ncbi:MAG: hypothetical protein WCC22_17415 [Terriglobales bacterium]
MKRIPGEVNDGRLGARDSVQDCSHFMKLSGGMVKTDPIWLDDDKTEVSYSDQL